MEAMQEEGIRLLGRAKPNGELLTFQEGQGRRDSKLVEIEPEDVKDHLVMIYFLEGYGEEQEREILNIIEALVESEFRSSHDKYDRKYWYRVSGKSKKKRGSRRRSGSSGQSSEYHNMMKEKYPSLKNDPDAEHWIDMADDVGCDPETLRGNWD